MQIVNLRNFVAVPAQVVQNLYKTMFIVKIKPITTVSGLCREVSSTHWRQGENRRGGESVKKLCVGHSYNLYEQIYTHY